MKVFYSSPWVPAEWIEAHGLQPRGVWHAEDFGGGNLPLAAGVCAVAEAMARFANAHRDSVAVFTTTCDQMRRSFDTVAAANRDQAFLFNIPATWQAPTGLRIYRAELERLSHFLQAHGGHAPIGETLARIAEQRSQGRQRLLETRPHCSARQFAAAIAQFHWDGSAPPPSPPTPPSANSIPLALVGGPLPRAHWKLLDLLESAGGQIVLNATENGERSLMPVVLNQRLSPISFMSHVRHETDWGDPAGALAEIYFWNCVDVFQRPNTPLYSWLEERLAARAVRGMVLWFHTGCDLWRAEAQTLRENFSLPLLMLEADEAQPGSPRQAGRIEAFMETLK